MAELQPNVTQIQFQRKFTLFPPLTKVNILNRVKFRQKQTREVKFEVKQNLAKTIFELANIGLAALWGKEVG